VDGIRRWKPAPEPYLWAATQLGVEPGQVALVAAHLWDGAHTEGLTSAWVNRTGAAWPTMFPPPDVIGHDLPTIVAGLLDTDQTP
jgi:2-haloacid dehalogenase